MRIVIKNTWLSLKEQMTDDTKYRPTLFRWALGIFSLLLFFMFFQQASSNIDTDLVYHMQAAKVNAGYSLLHIIFFIFAKTPIFKLLTSIFLTLCVVGTVFAVRQLVKENISEENRSPRILDGLALSLLIVSMIVLYHINRHWYLGQGTPNPWHNPTYLICRFFAVFTVLFFIRAYKKGILTALKDFTLFCLFLTISTFAKPSFSSVFMPTVTLILVFDVLRHKNIKTLKIGLLTALSFLPSLGIIFWQSMVLYDPTMASGLALSTGQAWTATSDNVFLSLFSAYAFPLFVLSTKWNRNILSQVGLGCYLFGIIWYTFLVETGPRAAHYNMAWGLMLGVFFFFVAASVILAEHRKDKKWAKIAFTLYGLHLLSGFIYLLRYIKLGHFI